MPALKSPPKGTHATSTIVLLMKRHICPLMTPRRDNKGVCHAPKNRNNLGMIVPYSTDWTQIVSASSRWGMQSECWELEFLGIWGALAGFDFEVFFMQGVFNSAINVKALLYSLGGKCWDQTHVLAQAGQMLHTKLYPSSQDKRSALEYTCKQQFYHHPRCSLSSKRKNAHIYISYTHKRAEF